MAIDIDRERLAFVMMGRLKEMELTQAQLARLSGATTRQISFIKQGLKVEAGAVIAVALVLRLDLWGLFSGDNFDRLKAVQQRHAVHDRLCETEAHVAKNDQQKQTVTPEVSRETA